MPGTVRRKNNSILFICFTICIACICFLVKTGDCNAQNIYSPLNSYSYHVIDRADILFTGTKKDFIHTSLKPYNTEEISRITKSDYFFAKSKTDTFNYNYLSDDFYEGMKNPKPLLKIFYTKPAAFYSVEKENENFSLYVNPVLNIESGKSSYTSGLKFFNSRGFEIEGAIDNKVAFYLYATDNQANLPAYVNERINNEIQVMPGEGRTKSFKGNGVDYLSTRGYIAFNATKHINIQFGQDKIFIGDGMRSLIWSDNSNNFLLLKINTHVWKLDYENIFAQLANYLPVNINDGLIQKKYAAFHQLSLNITPDINIGAFESVIFNRTDSAGNNTGFELNYMNPVIFYRAVESGLGSADNVLIGTNWKWNFLHHFSFYGQFVLDEFVFDQLFSTSGWWGNKYGVQAGIKYINAFSIKSLDLQFEHNSVRPYTYAYDNANASSYTNYAQAIAHPLGANFKENIFSLWYQVAPKIIIQNNLITAMYGSDTSGSNWGGNIFLDYNTYQNEFGNETAQGVKNNLLLNDLIISWQFWHDAFLDARFIYRKNNSELNMFDTSEKYFSIGIRLNAALNKFYF